MIKWILLIGGYFGVLVGFRRLGGIRAAGDAITAWGRGTAARRRKQIGSKLRL